MHYSSYNVPFSCYILKWHVHLRSLHSFPTRRSSDLAQRLRKPGRDGLLAVPAVDVPGPSRPADRILDVLRLRGQGLDRKSTRLNSSHLVISYAVFCLKKKIL